MTDVIKTIQHKGASDSLPKAVFGVREDATVKAYPTSAGTATVYTSNSPLADCNTDIAAGNFSSGVASWDAWSAGAVTAKTLQIMLGPATCVVIVPASGIWTLEVTQ